MPSEWRVTSNWIGDQKLYQVYRLRDKDATDHSGNREYYGNYTEDRQEAVELADELNRWAKEGNK